MREIEERDTLHLTDRVIRKSGCLRGSPFMKLRTLFLAAIALVVLAGSVVPTNAYARHHHRHHHHHS